MIFLSFVDLYVLQKSEKVKLYYKSSSDDKILSSFLKKAWSTCTFLNHFGEAYELLLCYRIDFATIPFYIELT